MTDYDELVAALRSASTVSTAWEKLMMDAADAIEALQAQLPKRGEWIKRREFVEDWQFDGFRCSICNWWKGDFETYNYCPKCGAKMEVQE